MSEPVYEVTVYLSTGQSVVGHVHNFRYTKQLGNVQFTWTSTDDPRRPKFIHFDADHVVAVVSKEIKS